ncbi:aminotransferase-like domain-containing protein [Pseudomonas japonica]|uniref:aminotransferase-like domain-containing protein n=1 Tax=Pseudomonas japonica TaxID=256466 RepID=UPI0015E3AB82|nr:PLP-dependent aminotransferase family protein [Pseudomonas japonica]MBA1288564.1 PLP-dependent aminotransferase family protein [Pseudomonas japonica]
MIAGSGDSPAHRAFLEISEALASGTFQPGQQLPSIRRWASRPGLSFHGVVRAYERLEALGRVVANPGRGYFMAAQGMGVEGMASVGMAGEGTGSLMAAPPARASTEMDPFWALFHASGTSMKLGCGWLPPEWTDTRSLARVIRRTATFARSSLVEYGDPAGYLPMREALACHLRGRHCLPVTASHILTTLGATQALDLIIRLLVSPGDRVLVDDPCNSNLIRLLHLRGAEVIGITRLNDGPDLDAVRARLQEGAVRAFFINARLHNPTGTSVSPRQACSLLKLSAAHGMLLVEDDVYGDFCSGPAHHLASLSGLTNVVYVGSFSKTLSANLRVGYVAAPPGLIARLADLKLLTSVAVPGFCERFIGAILADGSYERHVRKARLRLQTAQATTRAALERWGWELYYPPREGMFVWVRHPRLTCTQSLIEAALAHQVLLAPGRLFSADGRETPWLRINVAHFDLARAQAVFEALVD